VYESPWSLPDTPESPTGPAPDPYVAAAGIPDLPYGPAPFPPPASAPPPYVGHPTDTDWLGQKKLVDLWDRLENEKPLRLDAIVQAHAAALGLYSHLPDVGQEANELRRRLRTAFDAQHGRVVAMYLCSNRVVGGCALTEGEVFGEPGRIRRTLHTVLTTTDGELLTLEDEANSLARDAVAVFGDRPVWLSAMRRATDEIYESTTQVLYAAEKSDDDKRAAAIESARRKLVATADRTAVLIQRQSRFSYFGGVLVGALLAIALCVLLGLADRQWWSGQVAAGPFLAAGVFGTLGAVVSVFQRIASGSLVIDYTAGLWQKRLLGALRPVVGGVLGIAAHFVLVGGVLSGQLVSSNPRSAFAFFALVGFAAGFTERFATDLIERAASPLGGGPGGAGDRV
jgi:hypothetical protein